MGGAVITLHVEGSNIHQGEGKDVTMFDAITTYELRPSGVEVETITKLEYSHRIPFSVRPNKTTIKRKVLSVDPNKFRGKPLQIDRLK